VNDHRRSAMSALAAALVLAPLASAEPAPVLTRTVKFLASDDLAGRLTGSAGEEQAARYIAGELERIGARPLPGKTGFVLPFEFTSGTKDAGSSLAVAVAETPASETLRGAERIRALSFSDSGSAAGEVVFAGYGMATPEIEGGAYDSYVGIDVKDKIVVALRYSPEDVDPDRRALLARHSGLRYKALAARERGAKALLVVTGPRSANAGELVPMSFDAALGGSGILAASISGAVAERLFATVTGKTLEAAQAELDTGNPHVTGFAIPGVRATLDVRVEREKRTAHSVAGVLAASADAAAAPASYIVLGAHLDHLGRGDHGTSLARDDERGEIHYGADDDASGVAAVLRAGEMLKTMDRRRAVVLGFWSGEEIGLLGSSQFLKDASIPTGDILAYVNFDMVGRMKDGRLNVQGIGSSPAWRSIVERANAVVGVDVRMKDDPYLPTDTTSFYLAGIPVLDFFTGSHEDYHRPTDRAEKIEYEGLERVARLGALVASKVAALDERPAYAKVEPKTDPGSRDGLRVFTGTIPDYTTEVDGLRLSGVVDGGPAEKAGLRQGDVIVEFAGQRVANIYDYTHALERAKIGQPVRVVVVRDGQRLEVAITPTARK
jgi:Zn-dependent M28 family amino/carboxypeptidase